MRSSTNRSVANSDLAHQLKTPLTAIIGYIELLETKEAQLDPKSRAWLANLHQEANRLHELINTLLMSKTKNPPNELN